MKRFGIRRAGVVGGRARRALLVGLLVWAAAGAAARAQSDRLVVRVTDSGFAPAQATVDAGLVHLVLENGSSSEVLKIRVGREGGGEAPREVEIRGRGAGVLTELDASTAGVYTLTEAEHGWVFRLTARGAPPAPMPAPPPGVE